MAARPSVRPDRGVLAIVMCAALLLAMAPAAGAGQRDRRHDGRRGASAATIHWRPCYEELALDFECAIVPVPLDHDRPRGRQIGLAVVRLPATGAPEAARSLFLNPGGPGGSGVDFVTGVGPFADQVWGPEVRQRYDLVGVDPRGIARSTPLRCFETEEQAIEELPAVPFPLTRAEVREFVRADRAIARACRRNAGPIVRHMSTANVARDLEVLRQRVGDRRLNYLGLSYGSFLGVTYANLFPERVGAFVVDGVLDPERWSNVRSRIPFSTALRSDEGAQETLERFFVLCDEAGPDACALAPGAADRYAALAARLRDGPITVVDPETGAEVPITYQDLVGISLGALFDPFAYPFLAQFVAIIEAGGTPEELGEALADLDDASGVVDLDDLPEPAPDVFPEVPEYRNVVEGPPAVFCSDSDNPRSHRSWVRAGARADATYGYFGRIWTWVSSPCAQWPFDDRDRYTGPYRTGTATPVLVIGNLYDPATRYEGAQRVSDLLAGSALLAVDVPGHTSLGLSACAGALTAAYLLAPTAAAPSIDGQTCPQEYNPFTLPPMEADARAGLEPQLRLEIMPDVAYRPRR